MKDLRNLTSTKFQSTNKYNLFGLRFSYIVSKPRNIVPPILHIRIGIGKKLLQVFDNILLEWSTDESSQNLGVEHLATCLSNIGAHCKNITQEHCLGAV